MLVKFDLSPIPSDATIESATLSLYTFKVATSCCSPYGPMAQCTKYLYTVTEDWAENTVNWNNKPAISSSSTTQCTNTNVPAWEEFDVTDAVKEMFAAPNANNGFLFRCKETGSDLGITMRSSESSEQGYKPKLTVTYEPGISIQQPIQGKIIPAKQYKVTIYNLHGKEVTSYVMKDISKLNKMLPVGVNIVKINNQKLKVIKQK